MTRLVLILALLIALTATAMLTGCGAVRYEHTTFAADGHTPTARYVVDRWQSMMDSQATSAHLELADGTSLDLQGASQQPDKTVVGAFLAIGQSIVGLGGLALRFLGL